MGKEPDSLLDPHVWRPALEKYGAVTRLTVALYDRNLHPVCDALPSTSLFEFFRSHDREPDILIACVRRCLEPTAPSPVSVVQSWGLAVVGTSLRLDGEIVGAAIAGYALVNFCQPSAIEALARQLGVPFRQLWRTALQVQPLSERRLAMHGELLNVLGDTILREADRTRRYQEIAAHLEGHVEERTLELASANRALALEVRDRTEAQVRVQKLLARLMVVQEEERHRIARDVHDHLGQQMTALKLHLEVLEMLEAGSVDWREALGNAQTLVRRLDDCVESFIGELRPTLLEDFGLAPALASFVEDWCRHHGIAGRFHDLGYGGIRLDADTEINLFRITQEALNNVYKHANATCVDVRLQVGGDKVVLTIEDNGGGFRASVRTDAREERMGLIGMQERVTLMHGALNVETAPGRGTSVIVAVPK